MARQIFKGVRPDDDNLHCDFLTSEIFGSDRYSAAADFFKKREQQSMEAIPWSAPLSRQFERGEKIVVVGRSKLVSENFSCQTLQLCNDCAAAVDYCGFIKVDEVDGRSPVERAAATFVPDLRRHCAVQMTKSAVEFFAAVRSFKIKQPNRNFHRKISDF